MSNGRGSDGKGPEFDLPNEILSVIPTDPYDQLDLARKLTSMAIASRVSKLEAEVSRLLMNMTDKDRLVYDLEEKASNLDRALQEAESRLKITLADNLKLSQERDSLSGTVKKLSRDLAKLETFKRQLMQSLNEDSPSPNTVDIGTCDQSVSRDDDDNDVAANGYVKHHRFRGINESRHTSNEAKQAGQKISTTYHITPRLTPTGTPKIISTSSSPKAYSAVGSPQRTSGSTTPNSVYDGKYSLSSWYPSSQQSSAASTPPNARRLPGRTPKIDGKEFFRQARSRLSYEQFSAFLANIKNLNAQKQSREETLKKAEDIFGAENKDLYVSFQGLLSRNAP